MGEPKREVAASSYRTNFDWMRQLNLNPQLILTDWDPKNVKAAGAWWVYSRRFRDRLSAGIRITSDPNLFNEFFPNYGEALRNDIAFWQEYFQNPVQGGMYLPSILPNELFVATSSLGCLSVLGKYGGDYAFFGSSETMYDIVPAVLAQNLSLPSARVAGCARSAHVPERITSAVRFASQQMKRNSKPKLKGVIVGISQFWGYPDSKAVQNYSREQDEEFREFLHRQLRNIGPGFFHWKGRLSLLKTWNDLFPVTWESLHEADRSTAAEGGYDTTKMMRVSDFQKIPRGKMLPDTSILAFNARDSHLLPQMAQNTVQEYFLYDGIQIAQCSGLKKLEEDAKALVATLKDLAEHVYLVLTPVTASHEMASVACLRPGVKQIIQGLASQNVHVLTQEMEGYGLTAYDFTYKKTQEQTFFDPHHLNYSGAQKFTRAIATWINKE